MEEYNKEKSIIAQREYCNEKGMPHFAPVQGVCFRCRENIYDPIEHERKDCKTGEIIERFTTGISVEKAGSKLVTGCPHCNRSYCD